MRTKLNFKLVATVGTSFVLIGVGVHLLHSYQLKQNAYRLLERGDAAAQARDLDKALANYSQYLNFVPNDVDALQKYVLTLDLQASSVAERVELVLKMQQVLRAKPHENALRLRLVHNLISLGRIDEATTNLRKLQGNWHDQAEILHMLGWCLEAQKRYPEAAENLTAAIGANKQQIRSYVLLAEVQEDRLGQPDEAEKTMDRLVQCNPDAYMAYLVRARFLRRRGNDKAADGDLRAAYRLGSDKADVLLDVANAARAKENWPEAQWLLREAMERFPENTAFVNAIVEVDIAIGHPAAAIKHLRMGIDRAHGSNDLKILLIDLLIDQKQYAEARIRLDDLEKRVPTACSYFKARLFVADKNYRQAIPLLEKARRELDAQSTWHSKVNMILGDCHHELGDINKALQAYWRAVQDNPTWTKASVCLGAALLANGRIDEALQILEPLKTAKDVPEHYWILLSRARLYRQQQQPASLRYWAEVEDALSKAAKGKPTSVAVALVHAELQATRGDFEAARKTLEKAKIEHASDVEVWCVAANLEAKQGRFEASEHILDQAAKKLGDKLEIRLACCRLWGMQSAASARAKLAVLDEALPASFTSEQRARLRRELADLWYRLGDSGRAEKCWRAIANEFPNDTGSRFALLELALQKDQPAQAHKLRDELRILEGNEGALWLLADAAILVHYANGRANYLADAHKKLSALEHLHMNLPKAALLSATISELEGKHQSAIHYYSRALELGAIPPESMARLMQLLVLNREFSTAETELARYEQRAPLTKDLARLGAEAALGLRDPRYAKLALKRAEFAVALPATDYRDAIWLARIYQGAGENAKAEKLLQASLTQAGHVPDVWVAWMEFLTKTNQRDKASHEIERLKNVLPAEDQAMTLAWCYEALWQWASATKVYEDALAKSPDDITVLVRAADFFRRSDRPTQAEKCYRRLLDPVLPAPAEIQVLARRRLAIIIAARDAKQATALLEQNKRTVGQSIADERIGLFIQHLTTSVRQDAIAKFDETLNQQPPTMDERLLYAAMLESDRPGAACDQLAVAVVESPDAPQYLVPYIHLLIRTGDLLEAERQLARLETIEPSSPRTVAARAALVLARKA